jgi:hypothetical protein
VGAFEITALYPLSNSPFFNGSEFVLTGRYLDTLTIQTTINYADGPESYLNTASIPSSTNSHVELIWAQHRLTYLLRLVDITGSDSYRQEITTIALNYGLIIKGYTAIILTVDTWEDVYDAVTGTEDAYLVDPNTGTQTTYASGTGTVADEGDDTPFPILSFIFGTALFVYLKRRRKIMVS